MRESAGQTQHRRLNPERWEALRAVPLETVLRLSGAAPDLYDPHKWHTAHGALSVNGPSSSNGAGGVAVAGPLTW